MMEAYEKYRDSKVDWIREFPEHWNSSKLRWLSEIYAGGTPNTNQESYWENGAIPWLNSGTVNQRRITIPSNFITQEAVDNSSTKWVPKGSLVMALAGQGKTKGIVAILEIDATCNQSMAAIVPNKKDINSTYLFYWLDCNYGRIRGLAGAELRDGLNLQIVGDIQCPIPLLNEQTKIAQYLDHQTAIIDQLIQQKEKLIELLKEKRQAVINEAVTKGLPAEAAAKAGLNPNAKMKDSGIEWLGEVPEEWKVTSIKNILEVPITDGPHTTPDLFDDGVPFISAEAIKNGKIDFDKKRGFICEADYEVFSRKYIPKIKDIYMVKSGATTGNVAMVETNEKFTIWSPLAVFRANPKKVLPEYLHYFLQSRSLRNAVEVSWSYGTQQNIGMGVLSNITITYPLIKDQKDIVSYIENSIKKIVDLESPNRILIEKLKEYRQSIISEAVTGKIDVRDWQPNKQQVA